MPFSNWGLAAVFAAVSFLSPVATADVRSFTKIADTNTPIPNGTGNFTSLTHAQVSLGNIVFGGNGASNQRGFYRFNPATSAISVVIDQNTPLPGTPTATLKPTVANGDFGIYGPDVTFHVFPRIFDNRVLTTQGGLHEIARESGALGSYAPVPPISVANNRVAFGAVAPRLGGGGTVTTFQSGGGFVSHNTEDVEKFLARNPETAFSSYGRMAGTRGVRILTTSSNGEFWFSDGASSGIVPAPGFRIPGETTGYTFGSLGPGSGIAFGDDGINVAFRATATDDARNPTRTAILAKSPTTPLRVVADTNTVVPGFDGTTTFSHAFTDVTIDADVIAFIGSPTTGPAGIYTETNGALAELVTVGDTLDGKTISTLTFSSDRPLSDHTLAFTATFSDGSKGLYLASVPEPATLAWLACAAFAALRRRRPEFSSRSRA